MRNHFLLSGALFAMVISARAQNAMPQQPTETFTLVQQVCAACHGLDGNSTRAGVPSLAGQVEAYLERQLHVFAAQGEQRPNGVMGAIAVDLNADEMKRTAAYFARQPLHPSSVSAAAPQGRAEGRKMFGAGLPQKGIASCASCHGARGEGLPDRFPRLTGQHAPYIAEQLRHFRDGVRTSDLQAAMRNVAARLSDREIDEVSQYVALLR